MLTVGDEKYYEACINTDRWWESDLIGSLLQLVFHDEHNEEVLLLESNWSESENISTTITLQSSVKRIGTFAYVSGYYASIIFDIDQMKIVVADGLFGCLSQ